MFSKKSATAVQVETVTAPDPTAFLIEARDAADELARLRVLLSDVQQRHAQLLRERAFLLGEGKNIDDAGIPKKLAELYAQIQQLPKTIAQLEDRTKGIMLDGIHGLDAANSRQAIEQFRKLRSDLRATVQAARSAWIAASDGANTQRAEVAALNSRIAETESILCCGTFPRVAVQGADLPLVLNSRDAVAAFDDVLSQLAAW